jgi:hypothetical protein
MRVDKACTVIEGKPAVKLPIRQTAKGGESRARPSPGLRPYVLQQISINPQKLDSQDTQAGVCPEKRRVLLFTRSGNRLKLQELSWVTSR